MNRILIVFAHPRYEQSRMNRALLTAAASLEGVSVSDIYEEYADFNVDVEREKERLINHDIIVWQFPLYLYAPPALLKHWFELVMEFGWAYGKKGDKLRGKKAFSCVTTGGSSLSFSPSGHHRFSLREYLRPLEQIAYLCGIEYLPPFTVYGSYQLTDEELKRASAQYVEIMQVFRLGVPEKEIMMFPSLNDWLESRGASNATIRSV
ncbi:MAG: NAD(P)H-dependent oxidoreductase [Syntrophales bacterium]|nr:NAD(P)H-dependent oxidoreductase [Syntrophales bacterium]